MTSSVDVSVDQRKNIGRSLFYFCAGEWIPAEQLSAGRALLLLGDQAKELPYLDKLFKREQIVCVEQDPECYHKLSRKDLGIAIYNQDLRGYLRWALERDENFLLMNLDVYGTYRNQLEDSLSHLIHLILKNPDHIVGFTSTVGRDAKLLCEALVSIAILSWHDKKGVIESFEDRVNQLDNVGGFSSPVNLVLRDFLWMRDIVEQALAMSVEITEQQSLFNTYRGFSRYLAREVICRLNEMDSEAISLLELVKMSRKIVAQTRTYHRLSTELMTCVQVEKLVQYLYHSYPPWLVKQYFVQFAERVEGMPLVDSVSRLLKIYRRSEFRVSNRSDKIIDLSSVSSDGDGQDIVISFPKKLEGFEPKECPIH